MTEMELLKRIESLRDLRGSCAIPRPDLLEEAYIYKCHNYRRWLVIDKNYSYM